ncbi:MAG: hypothetical protein V4438_00245 [Patescibacteria group bacterium]
MNFVDNIFAWTILIADKSLIFKIKEIEIMRLKKFHQGTTFGIPATDGSVALPHLPEFDNPDERFERWSFTGHERSTPITRVEIIGFEGTASPSDLVGSIAKGNPAQLCLTRAQIPLFIKEHGRFLAKDGIANLFVISNGHIFGLCEAQLVRNNEGLRYFLHDASDNEHAWHSVLGREPRLVLPASIL